MAIVKVDEARQGLAGDSAGKGETNVDERGDDRGGKDEEICTEILAREATGQLQAASPAAGSCSGRDKRDKDVQEGAAGGVAARGRQGQPDSGAAALLRGARWLQGSATAAAAAAGGGTGMRGGVEAAGAAQRGGGRPEAPACAWDLAPARGRADVSVTVSWRPAPRPRP